jgi:sugar lactone lactonase YvrE
MIARSMGGRRWSAVLAGLALALLPSSASALAPCPGPAPAVKVLAAGQGRLESAIVDPRGRLFFTNETQLLRLDRPGATPKVLVDGVDGPGGLVVDRDGSLLMGRGNTLQDGLVGDFTGPAGILRVNPDTGATSTYATGLSMANGVARAPDGTLYGTNDLGSDVDRVLPGGVTQRGWAKVDSGNGDAVDTTGRWLYVNQTFRPAAVQRVDLLHPDRVTTYAAPTDPADLPAGLDGMTRDARDDLYLAANGAGQIWKVVPGAPPRLCLLVGGLAMFPSGPSAVATGVGHSPFPARNLYAVTFGGDVLEIPGVVPAR